MKATISKLNQSGLRLDEEAVKTVQAASRADWNPGEQLVLVTIPDVRTSFSPEDSEAKSQLPNPSRNAPTRAASDSTGDRQPHLIFPGAVGRTRATTPGATSDSANPPVRGLGVGHRPRSDLEIADGADQRPADQGPREEAEQQFAERISNQPPVNSEVAATGLSLPIPFSGAEDTNGKGHAAVVDAIIARFGQTANFQFHFCDLDRPQRSAEACLTIGFELAERMKRRILLLDASRTNRPLSCLLGVDLAAGFREVVRTELNWRRLVRPTSHPLVEILPAGVVKLALNRGTDQELAIRQLLAELSQHYGGICSCADNAYELESELLGRCGSGTFLTIDLRSTSRGLARAAIRHLQTTGNRLMGCLAATTLV